MGQTASQIVNHIENQRENLSSNLHELENKVKAATDWHHQFRNRPLAFIGLAAGGGAVLAMMAGGSRRRARHYNSTASAPALERQTRTYRAPSPAMEKAQFAMENVKGALIGIAATRIKDYADQIIPGFAKHYHQAEVERKGESLGV